MNDRSTSTTFSELFYLCLVVFIFQAACDGRPGYTVRWDGVAHYLQFGEQ